MKWSFKIGRILGIDVFMHVTFLLLLGFVGLANWMADRTVASAVSGVVFFLLLFACVLLHEYGHALAARSYGIATRDITLLPIGGLARLERMPDKPAQELWVALAGPLVNVVIAAGLLIGLMLKGTWNPETTGFLNATRGTLAERLLVVNVFLVLFNLLPAFPMDGGRVLRALLALRMPYAGATRVAASIGKGMAFLFGFIGLFGNPMLLLIALFVWVGAGQEAAAAEMKTSLEGARVRDAMLTEFRVASPGQPLSELVRMLLAGSQQDFPVVQDGRVVGLLTRAALLEALRERGEATPVSAVMREAFEPVNEDESLESAIASGSGESGQTRPVLCRSALVGLLTPENVGEYLMVRAALSRRASGVPPRIIEVPPIIRAPVPAYGSTRT